MLATGDVKNLEEGTCIAVYRAYILASGIIQTDHGKEMKTYVCHDKWALKNKQLDDLPFFALLEQLYNDRMGIEMEPSTKNKYELFIDQLISKGTIEYINESADETIRKSFHNLQFKSIPSNTELCKEGRTGLDTITDTGQIENALSVYNQIGDELVTLIKGISKILNEILDIPLFVKEGRIKLRPIFVNDKRGAHKVLNDFTEKVRNLLEHHVLTVEEAYHQGFSVITKTTVGSLIADIPAEQDELAKALVV
jgi:hypothetical protein